MEFYERLVKVQPRESVLNRDKLIISRDDYLFLKNSSYTMYSRAYYLEEEKKFDHRMIRSLIVHLCRLVQIDPVYYNKFKDEIDELLDMYRHEV